MKEPSNIHLRLSRDWKGSGLERDSGIASQCNEQCALGRDLIACMHTRGIQQISVKANNDNQDSAGGRIIYEAGDPFRSKKWNSDVQISQCPKGSAKHTTALVKDPMPRQVNWLPLYRGLPCLN